MHYPDYIKRLILPLFLILFCSPIYMQAQSFGTPSGSNNTTTNTTPTRYDLEQLKGTYQIQVINYRGMPNIPDDLAKQVTEGRLPAQTNNIMLGTHVRLMVLSQNAIDDPGFVPIEQEIVWDENFRPGRMETWGFGPEDLKAIDPRIILVRVSGYG